MSDVERTKTGHRVDVAFMCHTVGVAFTCHAVGVAFVVLLAVTMATDLKPNAVSLALLDTSDLDLRNGGSPTENSATEMTPKTAATFLETSDTIPETAATLPETADTIPETAETLSWGPFTTERNRKPSARREEEEEEEEEEEKGNEEIGSKNTLITTFTAASVALGLAILIFLVISCIRKRASNANEENQQQHRQHAEHLALTTPLQSTDIGSSPSRPLPPPPSPSPSSRLLTPPDTEPQSAGQYSGIATAGDVVAATKTTTTTTTTAGAGGEGGGGDGSDPILGDDVEVEAQHATSSSSSSSEERLLLTEGDGHDAEDAGDAAATGVAPPRESSEGFVHPCERPYDRFAHSADVMCYTPPDHQHQQDEAKKTPIKPPLEGPMGEAPPGARWDPMLWTQETVVNFSSKKSEFV